MIEPIKRYLFVSDFDQTLSFNDSGQVLAEMIGISPQEFERKARGMAKLNLVQQGGELAYLLLHDPEFRSRVRKNMLYEVGRRVRLKPGIDLLYKALRDEIPGYEFEFYVISAGPVQVIRAALEGIVPPDHIFGTEFKYSDSGEIETIEHVTAGYGKVAMLDKLQYDLMISPDHIIYVGDGSSDVHVMLHVNRRDGFTIAVSENRFLAPIAKRSILADDALPVIIPILEEIVGWNVQAIRAFFAERGYQIQEWEKVHTDKLTLRPLAAARDTAAAG
ncbi:MAG TPA: HAD-IB family phosphatase [Candidatus Acidoferrales bacterium]|nr:HAD-IB family phosphatase [Candidatus Acidoferrales bacterium]